MSLTPAAPRTKFRNHADHAVHHIFTMADDRDYVRPGVPTRQPTIVVLKGCHQVRRVKRNYCEYCFFCSFLLLSLHVALCLISRRMPSADYCHSHAFFHFSHSTLLYVLHAQMVVLFSLLCVSSVVGCRLFPSLVRCPCHLFVWVFVIVVIIFVVIHLSC